MIIIWLKTSIAIFPTHASPSRTYKASTYVRTYIHTNIQQSYHHTIIPVSSPYGNVSAIRKLFLRRESRYGNRFSFRYRPWKHNSCIKMRHHETSYDSSHTTKCPWSFEHFLRFHLCTSTIHIRNMQVGAKLNIAPTDSGACKVKFWPNGSWHWGLLPVQ